MFVDTNADTDVPHGMAMNAEPVQFSGPILLGKSVGVDPDTRQVGRYTGNEGTDEVPHVAEAVEVHHVGHGKYAGTTQHQEERDAE